MKLIKPNIMCNQYSYKIPSKGEETIKQNPQIKGYAYKEDFYIYQGKNIRYFKIIVSYFTGAYHQKGYSIIIK